VLFTTDLICGGAGEGACQDGHGVRITCEEKCVTPLSKKRRLKYDPIGTNKKLTKELFASIGEKRKLESKKRLKQYKNEFGYKDIKLGMLPIDIQTLGVCSNPHGEGSCYNKTGWSFSLQYEYKDGCVLGLEKLMIDVGSYSTDFHEQLFKTLRKKYKKNHGYSDRELEQYNAGELGSLNIVFEDGALGLVIFRRGNKHRLAVVYQNEELAKNYLKETQAQKADDF
jgi:hypothetical protein